jgi:hypothetical protein
MEVLLIEETERVAGGLLYVGLLGALLSNLETVAAAVRGAVDGFMDGLNGKTFDDGANPNY